MAGADVVDSSVGTVEGRSERFVSLDGLRGCAALVVLIHHCLLPTPQFSNSLYGNGDSAGWSWLVYSPLHFVVAGPEAVLVFFAISGFVLTIPVVRSQRFHWLAYYPSRVVRLYIPIFAAVAWSLLLVAIFPRSGLSHNPSIWMQAHGQPLAFWVPFKDTVVVLGASSLDGPLWSLRWEVIFSLLLPLYVLVGIRLGRVWSLVTLAVAVGAAVVTMVGFEAVSYLLMFAVGVVFATGLDHVKSTFRRINESRFHRFWWALLVVFGILALTARWTVAQVLPTDLRGIVEFLVTLGAAAWLYISLGSPLALRLLSGRCARWLGAISFSLYLTHEPVIVALAQMAPNLPVYLRVLLGVSISLPIGWIFFRLVERPTHRFARSLRGCIGVRARNQPQVAKNRTS